MRIRDWSSDGCTSDLFVTATRPWVPCAWRGWRPHGIVAPPGTGARHANPVDPPPRPGLDSRLRLRPADPIPRGDVLRKLGLARQESGPRPDERTADAAAPAQAGAAAVPVPGRPPRPPP